MTLAMPPLSEAAAKIAGFEGWRAEPYLDSASVPTIAYGNTHYPDGRAVSMTDAPVTQAEGLAYLEHDLTDTAVNFWRFVTRQPTTNQFSAMLSLAYNIGWPAISRSTMLREFNAGSLPNAANAFLSWDRAHVDGALITVPGLLNRRQKERVLFLTPDGQAT